MTATITRWRSASSVLGKTYVMGPDGPQSTTRGELFDGRVEVFRVDNATELVKLVHTDATSRDLFTLGVPQDMAPGAGSMGITTTARRELGCVSRNEKTMFFNDAPGWALLDIDCKDAPAGVADKLTTADQVLTAVLQIIPNLHSYEFALLPSSSSGLLMFDGTPAKRPAWHLFILLENQSKLPETLHALLSCAFVAGWGWPMVTKAGSIRPRGLVDLALCPTNQPIFPGSVAACQPPLYFAKPAPLINSGRAMPYPSISWDVVDSAKRAYCDMAAETTVRELARSNAAKFKQASRDRWLMRGMTEAQANAKLAQHQEELLHDDDILTLNDGSEMTVAEALDAGDRLDGVYMRDPFEPEYGTSRAVLRTKPRATRPHEKPVLLSFAHGGTSGFDGTSFRPSKVYRFARHEAQSAGVPLGVLVGFGINNRPAPALTEAQDMMVRKFRSFSAAVENSPPSGRAGEEAAFSPRQRVAIFTATGLGKTEQVAANAANLVRGGKTVVIAVPRHNLVDAVAERVRAKLPGDIRLKVYRGRSAKVSGDQRMCARWKEAEAVADAGANVSQALCGSGKPGEKQCPYFDACPYIEQTQAESDIWIVPHALLAANPPACLGDVGVLFVDEDPLTSLISGPELLTLDAIAKPLALGPAVDSCLRRVCDALRNVPAPVPGRQKFSRAWVPSAVRLGLDADDLRRCYSALAKAMERPEGIVAADHETVMAVVARVAAHNRHLRALCHLLKGLFLRPAGVAQQPENCPYVERRTTWTKAGLVEQVAVYTFNNLGEGWRSAHTMLLSATARPELMQHIWPDLTAQDELSVRQVEMPNVRVRQTVDTSMSRNKWHANVIWQRRIWKYIRKRAAQYDRTLVVAQKELVELLLTHPPIDGVDFIYFNNLSGIDYFGSVDLIISIGRVTPSVAEVERMAAVVGHCDVQCLPAGDWYPLREAFLPLANTDAGVALQRRSPNAAGGVEHGVEYHPDPLAEALRWTICVGELVQALGRGRGLRRTEANPLQLDVLTTQDTGIPVNEFGLFEQFEATAFEQMIVAGLVPQFIENRGGAVVASEVLRDLFNCDPVKVQDARRRVRNKAEYDTTPVDGQRPTRGVLHGFTDSTHPIHGAPWPQWSTCRLILIRPKRRVRVPCYINAQTLSEARDVAQAALKGAPHLLDDFKPSNSQADTQLAEAARVLRQAEGHPLRQDKRSPGWAGWVLTDGLGIDDLLAKELLHQLVLKKHLTIVSVPVAPSGKHRNCFRVL